MLRVLSKASAGSCGANARAADAGRSAETCVDRLENVKSLAPRADAEAAASVPDMCSHRVRREYEKLGDLSGSQPFAVEAEDRGLARS